MSIEIAKLHRMLKLETAAGAWFDQLNTQEKEAYKKAHPNSKLTGGNASQSKMLPSATMAKATDKRYQEHRKLENHYETKAERFRKAGNHDRADLHDVAANHHGKAAESFRSASLAYSAKSKSQKIAAEKHAEQGAKHANKAAEFSEEYNL
jgi:aspartate ammonia-lyase